MKFRFVVLLLGLGGSAWAACSLGEGVTPDCDATLPPGDPAACQLSTACDAGRGLVVNSDECCLDASSRRFRSCLSSDEAFDPAPCMANPPPAQCTCPSNEVADRMCAIADACAVWITCKAGALNGAGGGGGAAGAAGAAGAGGAGGSGGAGGAGGSGGS